MPKDFMAFAKEWIFKNVHVPTESLVLFTVNGDSMDAPTSQIKDARMIFNNKLNIEALKIIINSKVSEETIIKTKEILIMQLIEHLEEQVLWI